MIWRYDGIACEVKFYFFFSGVVVTVDAMMGDLGGCRDSQSRVGFERLVVEWANLIE